ncbi:alpha/beta hydrolase [Kribbella solani]|uniref:alpha/beta hydrolase n=2 Tax=Kribbella solani TaxID=236067 RepID=UPI0029B78AE6|nr:alpha/beta hydrolase [Kribbella solani]MDX3003631.1 alpha/beta hydrolase [Kribbella solani]
MNPRLDSVLRDTLTAVQANALTPLYALPTAVRRRLAGRPIQIDGNTLDPEIQLMLRLENLLPHTTKKDAASARTHFRNLCKLIPGTPPELQRVTDLTVRGAAGQLGARLYIPFNTSRAPGAPRTSDAAGTSGPSDAPGATGAAAASGGSPASPASGGSRRPGGSRGLLVFFHGGGWVVGDLDTHDTLCRAIAADSGIRLLAVDYRRAPEAPAPTAAEDAIAAFTWAVDHAEDLGADPSLVAVGGDSSGGNLAAVVAQQCVRRDLPLPALQVLIYPALDLVARRPSRDLFSDGFILTEADIIWYRDHYTPDPALRPDPIVSPLRAGDLTGLPPTYLTTAGFDPLRDEGNEYAEALKAAGNAITHVLHPTLPHGHANLRTVPGTTQEAHQHLTNHLRTTLQ